MIEATKAYKTSDGATHATLEKAQEHALTQLGYGVDVAELILKNRDTVIAILKLKPRKAAKKAAPKAKAVKDQPTK